MRYIVAFYSELERSEDHFCSIQFVDDMEDAERLGLEWVQYCSNYPCCGWYRVYEMVNQ